MIFQLGIITPTCSLFILVYGYLELIFEMVNIFVNSSICNVLSFYSTV